MCFPFRCAKRWWRFPGAIDKGDGKGTRRRLWGPAAGRGLSSHTQDAPGNRLPWFQRANACTGTKAEEQHCPLTPRPCNTRPCLNYKSCRSEVQREASLLRERAGCGDRGRIASASFPNTFSKSEGFKGIKCKNGSCFKVKSSVD